MIGLGNPRWIVRVVLRSNGFEQAGADDFVYLLVRDRLNVGAETLEAFLQCDECLLAFLALRHFVLARREGRNHDRAGHLLCRFGQLLDEGHGLIGEARVSDRHCRCPHAVVGQFIQENQTRRCGLEDVDEDSLRNALALVVRPHPFVEGSALQAGTPTHPTRCADVRHR